MSRKKAIPYERKKSLLGFLFTLPWLLGAVYFFIIPFIYSCLFSVFKIKSGFGGMDFINFVGLKNYFDVFTGGTTIIKALTYELPIMLLRIPLIIVFSIFLSLILNSKFKGRTAVRGIFFLPVIIASGIIIYIMKNSSISSGLMSGQASENLFKGIQFNDLLISFGIPLTIVTNIMNVINGIFELVWKSGVQTVLFLAGLQSVPRTVYEAADIEGATSWEKFWKVTIPIISPQILLCAFYTIVDTSTDYSNVVIRFLREMALNQKYSESAAVANIWFLIIMFLVGILFFFSRKHVYYMDDRG